MEEQKILCPVCGADVKMDYKPVIELFGLWSVEGSTPEPINAATRVLTGRLLKKFGYEAVREAFIQAGINKERQRLEYVRGILIKKYQSQKVREHNMYAEEQKKDNITTRSSLITENNSNCGVVDEEKYSS